MTAHLTPALNHHTVLVAAPAILLADPDGQVGAGGVSGWFVDDVRLLDELALSVDGADLELVRAATRGADRQEVTYVARRLGGWVHDPTVTLDVCRTLTASGLRQQVTVAHRGPEAFDLVLRVTLGADLAPMATVRQGVPTDVTAVSPRSTEGGLRWDEGSRSFSALLDPAPDQVVAGRTAVWRVPMTPGTTYEVTVGLTSDGSPQFGPGGTPPWSDDAAVDAPDRRLGRLVEQSAADLSGLLLRDGDDAFLAAGSPWFLTLFGRDSLWAARLLMPFGTALALSTLRTLARRQGRRTDPASEEQPGKILHEVRATTLELGGMTLPPVYYGTVDATPLFVCTLADAAEWGAGRGEVAALLPAARRCLEWMLAESQASGWLRYVDESGHGLSNQGWKDSVDSLPHADGRLADPPIALSEVQGYAHEAAVRGAALLAAYDEPPVPGLLDWAAALAARFRRDFWVETTEGGHVAIALDGAGGPVGSVTSNMGHLLGTGILSSDQVRRVAGLLAGPDLSSGFGLRTLSVRSPRYNPLSYHCGSVWPHDTAIAVRGLAREGRLAEAAELTAGLVAAAEGCGYRLPELFAGDAASQVPFPAAYPAACRPQAWAAAAPLACLAAVTGLEVDAGGGVSHPVRTSPRLGAFTLHGLRVGGEPVTVAVSAAGTVETR